MQLAGSPAFCLPIRDLGGMSAVISMEPPGPFANLLW